MNCRPRFALALSSTLAIVANFAPCAVAVDWPHWRGPTHNGHTAENGWTTDWPGGEPRVLWRAKVNIGFSSLAVADGRVFTLGNKNDRESVWCLDAMTGDVLWQHDYDCPLAAKYFEGGPTSTPTVADGRVFTISRSGHVFCFDAANGDVIWKRNVVNDDGMPPPGWGFSGSPLVLGNMVIFNVGSSGMALDRESGEVLWATDAAEAGYSSPLPVMRDGETVLLMAGAKSWQAVDPADGRVLSSVRWVTKYDVNAADPVVAGDRVFVSSGYNRGGALLDWPDFSADPEIVWENKNLRTQMNPAVLVGKCVYGVDDDNNDHKNALRCLELATGDVLWSHKGIGSGSVIVADNHLIVLSARGELIIAPVSPDGFDPVARGQILGGKCWTAPALAHRLLYARNAKGDVVCVDLRK